MLDEVIAKGFAILETVIDPRREITPKTILAWSLVLQSESVSEEEFQEAIVTAAKTLKFWPKPQEILGIISTIRSRKAREVLKHCVIAIDESGERRLMPRSLVLDGRRVKDGQQANGIGVDELPVLDVPSSIQELVDGMRTQKGKEIFIGMVSPRGN
jgi:hypothetical protein